MSILSEIQKRQIYAWCSLLLEFLENFWNFEIFFHGHGKLLEKQIISIHFWKTPGIFCGKNFISSINKPKPAEEIELWLYFSRRYFSRIYLISFCFCQERIWDWFLEKPILYLGELWGFCYPQSVTTMVMLRPMMQSRFYDFLIFCIIIVLILFLGTVNKESYTRINIQLQVWPPW